MLGLEEVSARAEDGRMLTTEGSLAEREVRPGVSQCSGHRAVENPGSLLQKKKSVNQGREQPTREK